MTAHANVKIVFNHRGCGRCGGTGTYHVGVSSGWSKRVCYDCNGAGIKMSPATLKNLMAFRAWKKEVKPTVEQSIAELATGRFGKSYKIVTQGA